jgi:hypothetical protein
LILQTNKVVVVVVVLANVVIVVVDVTVGGFIPFLVKGKVWRDV